MSNELYVDRDQLRRSAQGMADVHQRLQEEHRRFVARLASYGRPWGNNNGLSQAIDSVAPVVQDACTSCHEENHAAWADYPAGLQVHAATHGAAEQTATELSDQYRQV
ncbi:hypothetical protein [Actinoallomurus soli]|uniref:hypothetical protein n=1 Tax=Actinoallomurus soli TaxID=2952535 RepID=UPI0020920A7F|nr:hypothetical protein [Actinoallomurus soli]MCO5968808.1 hypothetical protein [Actinoallomurus soli]